MSKITIGFLLTIVLASSILGFSILTSGHFWGDDFAAYIMQAQSILKWSMDEFVVNNAFTITQSSSQIGPVAYPWGFPLILAPAYALKGLSPLTLKLPGLLTYLAFLVTFFWLTNRHLRPIESLLAVALFAFNPVMIGFLDNILSDIPFLFASIFSILVMDRYSREKQSRRRLLLAIATGVTTFAAFQIRTQGIILLGSLIIYQAIQLFQNRKNRSYLLMVSIETTTALGTFGLLWGISALIFPSGQISYFALYTDLSIDLFFSNVRSYFLLFSEFFASLPGQSMVFAVVVGLFFIGMVARIKEDLLFVIFFGAYLFVLWTWPAWQGLRFIFPLLPFFIYFSMQGSMKLAHWTGEYRPSLSRLFVYTMWTILVSVFFIQSCLHAYENLRNQREINGPFDPYSIQVYEFIKDKTPEDSIIVFFKPRVMRLMTDRDTLASTECEHMYRGDYIVLSKKVGENLQIPPDRIVDCALPLELEYENRRFIIFRLNGTSP